MQKIILIAFILAALALLFIWSMANEKTEPTGSPSEEYSSVFIGLSEVKAERAETLAERVQGLSGRLSLGSDRGMLFIFEEEGFHGFWMKDMHFPIDIIWIDEDLRIVAIEENATPDSYPRVFKPKEKAKYVLEVPAGFVEENSVAIGNTVQL